MIKPLHDRVVVKKVNLEAKSAGGLYLGEIESERDVCYGIVLDVGKGKQIDGTGTIQMTVQPNDIIAFNDTIAKRINYTGEAVHMVRESDIYGIIPKEDNFAVTTYKVEKMDETITRKLN